MRRREFIAGLGGVAGGAARGARAVSIVAYNCPLYPQKRTWTRARSMSAKCQKSRSIAVAAGITIARADSSRVYAVVRCRSLSFAVVPWPTVTRVLPCVLKKNVHPTEGDNFECWYNCWHRLNCRSEYGNNFNMLFDNGASAPGTIISMTYVTRSRKVRHFSS
jgi:hypothetical protein